MDLETTELQSLRTLKFTIYMKNGTIKTILINLRQYSKFIKKIIHSESDSDISKYDVHFGQIIYTNNLSNRFFLINYNLKGHKTVFLNINIYAYKIRNNV